MDYEFDEWRSLHDVVGQVLSGMTDDARKTIRGGSEAPQPAK